MSFRQPKKVATQGTSIATSAVISLGDFCLLPKKMNFIAMSRMLRALPTARQRRLFLTHA